jgi:hypothetical protein
VDAFHATFLVLVRKAPYKARTNPRASGERPGRTPTAVSNSPAWTRGRSTSS